MTTELPTRTTSKAMLWTGRVISAIPVLMMGVMSMVILFAMPNMVTEGMTKYGYPAGVGKPLLIIEIVCALLYAIPQTAVLGAILLTGYLGGAVATHLRAGEPFWFPIVFGVLVWLWDFFFVMPGFELTSCFDDNHPLVMYCLKLEQHHFFHIGHGLILGRFWIGTKLHQLI